MFILRPLSEFISLVPVVNGSLLPKSRNTSEKINHILFDF